MANLFKKKVKLTITITVLVAILLAVISGILLFRSGENLTNLALKWIFQISVFAIILVIFTWIVTKTFGKLKFVKKR